MAKMINCFKTMANPHRVFGESPEDLAWEPHPKCIPHQHSLQDPLL